MVKQYREAGDDPAKIHALKQAGVYKINIYPDTVTNEEGEQTRSLFDQVHDDAASGDNFVDSMHAREQIRHIAQLLESREISERDEAIFRAYHGLDGGAPRPYSAIGTEFNITESRVAQIMKKVTIRLQAEIEQNVGSDITPRPRIHRLTPINRGARREKERKVVGSLREILETVFIDGSPCQLEALDLDRKLVRIRIHTSNDLENMHTTDSHIDVADGAIIMHLDTKNRRDKDTLSAIVGAQGQELDLRKLLVYRNLSNAERQYIRNLGVNDKEIAKIMGIAQSTARTHAHHIYEKTGWNAEQLTGLAVSLHFIRLPKIGLHTDDFSDFERELYENYDSNPSMKDLVAKFGMPFEAINATLESISERLETTRVKLTDRETEILPDYCSGMSYDDIAEKLGVSRSTVRTYIHSLYVKFGVHYKRELDVKAYAHGFTSLAEL